MALDQPTERKLILSAQAGDQHALAQLIDEHEPMLRAMVRRLPNLPAASHEDLLQEARLGFIETVADFDTERMERLNTAARHRARKAVMIALASAHAIAVPERTMSRYLAAWDGTDSYAEALANATTGDRPMNSTTFVAVHVALHGGVSLDSREDDSDAGSLHETIAAPAPAELPGDITHVMLSTLDAESRMIIEMAHGLDGGEPLMDLEIARALDMSRATVQRRRQAALRTLSARFGSVSTSA